MTDIFAGTPPPPRTRVNFWLLMFGACTAPIFWLGQMMLGYGVSALVCYRGDHPVAIASGAALRTALVAFDAVAIAAALAGVIVSYCCWRVVRGAEMRASRALDVHDGRAGFLSIWGLTSSGCFLFAILFNTIASIMVPLCVS